MNANQNQSNRSSASFSSTLLGSAIMTFAAMATSASAAPTVPHMGKGSSEPTVAHRVLLLMEAGMAKSDTTPLPGVERLEALHTATTMKSSGPAPRWFVAELAAGWDVNAAIEQLSTSPSVLRAEPDYISGIPEQLDRVDADLAGTRDPRSGEQYHLERVGAFAAWDVTGGSRSIVVAVIDTGVQLDHPDLAANLWTNPDETQNGLDDDGNGFIDDIRGWNFVAGNNNPDDDHSHGTHVAGIVAAVRDNNLGVAGMADVRIMPLKVLGADGSGPNSAIMAAIDYAARNGAHVINLSLGGGAFSQAYADVIAAAVARGVVVVAASGNDRRDSINLPAGYEGVIAVGGTDEADQLYTDSNFGEGLAVVAPGVRVLSTVPGSGYASMTGTSMATPVVAGLAALIRSANASMTVSQVRDRLITTADDLDTQGWDARTGFGRVNAARALAGEAGEAPVAPQPTDDVLEPNNSADEARRINDGTYDLHGKDEDWFRFQVEEAGLVTISVNGNGGDLDLFVFDENDEEITRSAGDASDEFVSFEAAPGSYRVVVNPFEGKKASYRLKLKIPQKLVGQNPIDAAPVEGGALCGTGMMPAFMAGLASLMACGSIAGRRTRRTNAV